MIVATLRADLQQQQQHPQRVAMLAADEVRRDLRECADATDRPAWEALQAADLLETVADPLGKAAKR